MAGEGTGISLTDQRTGSYSADKGLGNDLESETNCKGRFGNEAPTIKRRYKKAVGDRNLLSYILSIIPLSTGDQVVGEWGAKRGVCI